MELRFTAVRFRFKNPMTAGAAEAEAEETAATAVVIVVAVADVATEPLLEGLLASILFVREDSFNRSREGSVFSRVAEGFDGRLACPRWL
jgi:hypothetical protein